MKKWFWLGVGLLAAFEILRVYFIMPMPGSQASDTLAIAYGLHRARWVIRVLAAAGIVAGIVPAWKFSKVLVVAPLGLTGAVTYMFNAEMSADRMFLQPRGVVMARAAENKVDPDRLIVGVTAGDEARAYPIQFIGYHHQIRDQLAGKPIMVTYCTVCRTGRVYEPVVEGRAEDFRLVGMDHFNAMFEDASTGSWWRQATGEAVAGPRSGAALPEVASEQMTLRRWFSLHPGALVMQPDPEFAETYEGMSGYEAGKGGSLTGRSMDAWSEKAWVVGVTRGDANCAYDWNALEKQRVIRDSLGSQPIAVVLAPDGNAFFAYELPSTDSVVSLEGDAVVVDQARYTLEGVAEEAGAPPLRRANAYQEFWHSWRTFHPETRRF